MQNILDMKSLFDNDKMLIKQWSHYVCTLVLVCLWINEKIAMEFYTKLGILWPIEKRALVSGGWTRTQCSFFNWPYDYFYTIFIRLHRTFRRRRQKYDSRQINVDLISLPSRVSTPFCTYFLYLITSVALSIPSCCVTNCVTKSRY